LKIKIKKVRKKSEKKDEKKVERSCYDPLNITQVIQLRLVTNSNSKFEIRPKKAMIFQATL